MFAYPSLFRRPPLPATANETVSKVDLLHRERLNHLQALEAESLYILREAVAEFARPVMLYSIGKDSSVMLRLAQKAFYPGRIPFPLLHVDTSYKFREMITFRDSYAREIGAELIVHRNEKAIASGASPWTLGTQNCCGALKTRSLLDALAEGGFDAAFGGARRDEEKSRAKERVYSFRDAQGQWDPKNQRPELWSLYNSRLRKGESIRVFPLSNWTELDIWLYLYAEQIPIVPLYFAEERLVDQSRRNPDARGRDNAPASTRAPGEDEGPDALAWLRALHRRYPERSRYVAEDHRGADRLPPQRAREPRNRPR